MSDKGAALDKETEGLSLEEILAYEKEVKEALYKVHSDAIPMSEMRYFIDEMSLESKRYFISENLKSVPLNKAVKMSGKQLTLLLKTRSKSTKDQSHLKGVLLFILKEIYMNYHLDEEDDSLLKKELEIREQYGDWHYYFALQLAPFTNSDIKVRKEALLDELLEYDAGSINSKEVEIVSVVPNTEETSSKEKEILQQERKLRIEIQEKNDKLQAQVKQLEQLYAAALEKQKEDSSIIEKLNQRLQDTEVQKQEIHLALQEASVSLQKSTKQVRELSHENKQLMNAQNNKENEPISVEPVVEKEFSIEEACDLFYQSVRKQVTLEMEWMITRPERLGSESNRNHIQEHLQMLTVLERYKQDTLRVEDHVVSSVEMPVQEEEAFEDEIQDSHVVEPKQEHLGYFHRYSHGGRIDFEDGTSTNITEKMVTSIGLQHQAVVECREKEDGGYYVTLVLQGDDSLSNIHQFLGYVKYDSYNQATCVDIHSSEVYHVHFKDMDYWKVKHGDTGLFNIEKGSEVARISRIYPTNEAASLNSSKPAVPSKKDKPNSLAKETTTFLEGCKIVIVGGLEKWFDDTVRSTGAELIHNSGHQPQRVYSEIKNADALFLLLSANSHKATWGAVEAAKKYNVPIFKIEGSRSNLYSLLWEHQDKIKS